MSNKKKHDLCVWIVSGPSGSGKTTLCNALLKDAFWQRRLLKSVSYTTRPARAGEVAGQDYIHISEAKFSSLLKEGAFLEHEHIFGFSYGTPKKIMLDAQKQDKDLLLAIDVKGARSVRRFFGKQATSIFILPPNPAVLNERLRSRSTESKKDIEKRMRRVKIELSSAKEYDYQIVNDDWKVALKKLKGILRKKYS